MKHRLIFSFLFASVVYLQPAIAVKIVRLDIEYGSDTHIATGGYDLPKTNRYLDIELYDDVAPNTVANYLQYVNTGSYDLTFINRSVPGFVLQTGGISKMPGTGAEPLAPDLFDLVADFGSVNNEASLSNIRGTVAMAKVANQPDSATNEWFINLKDNSVPLDTENGGYTVFGSIIDNGIEIADQVATFPIINVGFIFGIIKGPFFTELPLADSDPDAEPNTTPPLDQSNLVMILHAAEINRPILRFTPATGNFGFTIIGGTSPSIDVVIKNTGNEIVDSVSVGSINPPFVIQTEDCSTATLEPVSVVPSSFCTISLQFDPTMVDVFNDILTIDYANLVSGNSFSVKYPLIGEGASGPPEINVPGEVNITSQVNGFSSIKDIAITNNGTASLTISDISLQGSADFSQTNSCINSLVAPGETCSVSVTYTANDFVDKQAILSIESDDPANNIVNVTLTGIGETDADSIMTSVEDMGPNGGDNNIDGTADSVQNDIASFVSKAGSYISIVVDSNNVLTNVAMVPDDQLVNLPSDVIFKQGVFKYEVDVDTLGDIANIGMILPVDSSLNSYYFFGETTDNATPHWYRYQAAQAFPNATINSANGAKRKGDLIKLVVQDGGPGDSDNMVNGRILLATGGPAYLSSSSDDSGSSSMNILFFVLFMATIMFIRGRYHS